MNIIVFFIEEKEYGLDIGQVREVIQFLPVIPVPDSADFVEGVIPWQGQVIPLVSFRKKIGLFDKPYNQLNRVLITQIGEAFIGIVVDEIGNVEKFDEAEITVLDHMLKDAAYLIGVAKKGDRVVLVIDIQKFLNDEDQTSIAHVNDRIEIRKKGLHG